MEEVTDAVTSFYPCIRHFGNARKWRWQALKLIVGLGNPGKKYEKTRHNVGFQTIDRLAEKWQIPLTRSKFQGIYGKGTVRGEEVMLLKPLTFMNNSGESVAPFMQYFQIPLDNLLIIYDELDLPTGKIRLRYKGSSGGHNGLKSIIQHLGTQQFKRIRIGIDRPETNIPIVNYVLGNFTAEEAELIEEAIERVVAASEMWLEKPFNECMNIYNR